MRRYRYGDPSKIGAFRTVTSLVYFVVAWNAVGIIAYYAWSKKKTKEDPDFEKKTSRQRYLDMIGFGAGSGKGEHIKIVGTKVVERTDMALGKPKN
ncbi:hypothetical protein ScPMuIL_013544 [Solemya velum]